MFLPLYIDYCHRYAATVGMTVLAMLPFALTPLGILSYAVTRRLRSSYNVNEEEEVRHCYLIL